MLTIPALHGQTFAVFGLARTGLSVCRALMASGARVKAWDDNELARARAQGEGIALADLMTTDLDGCTGLVLAPGVPLTHPQPHALVLRARVAGLPILGDTELLAWALADRPAVSLVGVTGTNGKSTTTALIRHILASAGRRALMAGNIGKPILDEAPPADGDVWVLELSSFQLDLTHALACDVAVITNMSADHLDRHGDMAGYARAKGRLFEMQSGLRARPPVAVIGQDDRWSQAMAQLARGAVVPISGETRLERGVCVVDGALWVDGAVCADQSDWPGLPGPHNGQNAAAAFAACRALGVETPAILSALETFSALAHRMEQVAERGGVRFINDSKATNPTSTAPALAAYDAIHWIVGGRRKADDLDACRPMFGNVVRAYTIGEAADLFTRLLEPDLPVERCGSLDIAVSRAAAQARPGEVVLLSPACASQDQFRDFEARGDAFRAAVARLGEETAA